ncbi:MAG: hypothetical protein ACR2OJ_05200 [Hyphomicrobiales bacterium]
MSEDFFEKGWCWFTFDEALAAWVEHALPHARKAVVADEHAQWYRCGGTWFAGVNALENDEDGTLPAGPALRGAVIDFISNELNLLGFSWDKAQISVCYPGYPKPMEQESEAAFRYRVKRDAAHGDGLHAEGPQRRRHLREQHGFLLGIPLVEVGEGAAPFVVWEGSHEVMREAFLTEYERHPPENWREIDLTNIYHSARQQVFEVCKRVEINAKPGEAYLVHRLALHGVAPWRDRAQAGRDGRMIVYFRPELDTPARWLSDA